MTKEQKMRAELLPKPTHWWLRNDAIGQDSVSIHGPDAAYYGSAWREVMPLYTAEQVTAAILADRERRAAKDAGAGDERPAGWITTVQIAGGPEDPPEYDTVFHLGDVPPDDRNNWTPLYPRQSAPPAPAPADDHPPSRHCGCSECAPSFEADPPAPAAPVGGAVLPVKMWHQRAQEAHPRSDPEFWPLSLKAGYMEDELIDLRRALAATQQAEPSAAEPELIAAARAVVERWHSPKWKDEAPTAEFIQRLERALDGVDSQTPASTGVVSQKPVEVDDNPWIPHNGGPCPVALDAVVDVRFRGHSVKGSATGWTAGCLYWFHDGRRYDIIEYRLHLEGGE